MSKLLFTTEIKRDRSKLYYCGTDEKGKITVCEADLKRGGKKKVNKEDETFSI